MEVYLSPNRREILEHVPEILDSVHHYSFV
jgi:hypothetical protein